MTRSLRATLRALSLALVLATLGVLAAPPHGPRGVVAASPPYALTVPLVVANRDNVVPHPFGVQIYGTISDAALSIAQLRTARVHWMRWEVNWGAVVGSVPTDTPAYNWYFDASARQARDSGLNVILTILGNPAWAALQSPDGIPYTNGPIRPEYLDEFAAFVSAAADRYPWITYYEFYNEPDNAGILQAELGGPYWGPYGAEYAAMLKAVYPALKAANPEAQVVLGGIAYDLFEEQVGDGQGFRRSFLDDVLAAGGGEWFDVFNFHYYPAFAYGWEQQAEGRELVAKANYLRALLADAGYGDKPFFCTEVGAPSGASPDHTPQPTPESQARYVTQTAARAVASDLGALIWFAWKDFAGDSVYEHYGLVTQALALKPSALAFRAATQKLGSATYVRTLPLDEMGIEGYEFRAANGALLYLLWSVDGASRTVTFPVTRARLCDMYGTPVREVADATDGTEDGQIVVAVGGNPIYVEVLDAAS